ncbi:DUF2087 domain-containing protein [Nonomuraea sp. NPDC003804]|uniref:DUF2087 domain-containing protein n=1 Tax=Nonomuraea sp. NPDC003804 TaxID=3154547 RepID=UPI0033A8E78F
MNDEDIRRVLGLLHQNATLRAFAALVLGGRPEADEDVLVRLERGGLAVRHADGSWAARPERFRELLKAAAPPPRAMTQEERVLQAFLVDGRLREIPAKADKRLVILRHIVRVFEPGVRYTEKDVNVALRAFHHDFSALRRYLVDHDLLSRDANVYWRSGGPVEV